MERREFAAMETVSSPLLSVGGPPYGTPIDAIHVMEAQVCAVNLVAACK